jgi:hypothetical protein
MVFLAVNCFARDGDCKKNFNFVKFPNIVVHVRNVGFFSYTGPLDFQYISNYLDLTRKPIQVIDTMQEFLEFSLMNDVFSLLFV